MDWQPIETAPKDGTDILVYADMATVAMYRAAAWDDGDMWDGAGFASREEKRGWWWATSSCGQEKLWWEPTHWMPLPPPPEPVK